ncbi:MAG: putative molybdenum carrier protein [Bacteroidales bacterium]|nr:putative molybdenum carrier protein [Bacteroidales bacterium]
MKNLVQQIISGGQTGVDRASLDFASSHNIPCSGFCPKGRLAEDGRIPDIYPLKETETSDFGDRTEKNILASDGILILHHGPMAGGTLYTYQFAKSNGKPLLCLDMQKPISIEPVHEWIKLNKIRNLNIAGPRENQHPGIYLDSLALLKLLFQKKGCH